MEEFCVGAASLMLAILPHCFFLDLSTIAKAMTFFLRRARSSLYVKNVTTQDFIKFWGKIFVFILLVLNENFTGI
jgi:hypothetical protein